MHILWGIATSVAAPLDLLAHHPGGGPRYAEYLQFILPGLVAVFAAAMILWRLIRRG
jgi:hypothetical protein